MKEKKYFNQKGECIDHSGLAKHCRNTGQVFPLFYREAKEGETLSDICEDIPVSYQVRDGKNSQSYIFDTNINEWVESEHYDYRCYIGFSPPIKRIQDGDK